MANDAELTEAELNAYRDVLKEEGWTEQPCDYWVSPYGIRMMLGQAVGVVRWREQLKKRLQKTEDKAERHERTR